MRYGSVLNARALEGRTVKAVRFEVFEKTPVLVLELADRQIPKADPMDVRIRVVDADGWDPFDSVLVAVGRPGDVDVDVEIGDSGAASVEVLPA